MIDYPDMGSRIRKARIAKGLTQEKLSEIIGVGTSHMSHLESGKAVPSIEVFIALVNALDCSADELLCREIKTARPMLHSWLSELVADCDQRETKIIADTVVSLKDSLRRNRPEEY